MFNDLTHWNVLQFSVRDLLTIANPYRGSFTDTWAAVMVQLAPLEIHLAAGRCGNDPCIRCEPGFEPWYLLGVCSCSLRKSDELLGINIYIAICVRCTKRRSLNTLCLHTGVNSVTSTCCGNRSRSAIAIASVIDSSRTICREVDSLDLNSRANF